jgi:molybdenum cofactor cytidylyltransferase
MNIVGILLAGGHSRRFGSNKLLHPLADGQAVAVAAGRHLLAAIPDSVAIVRPEALLSEDQAPSDQRLVDQLRALGMRVIVCTEDQQEMGDSLSAAIRYATADREVDGFVIALADMPYIAPQTIRAVADALAAGAQIVVPIYQGQRGHPVGFAATFREALENLRGDEGARTIIQQHQDSVVRIEVDDAGILRDIDTPADLPDQSRR